MDRKCRATLCVVATLLAMPQNSPATEDALPDAALLEYLGEWETKKGEWIDPMQFLEEVPQKAEQVEKETEHE